MKLLVIGAVLVVAVVVGVAGYFGTQGGSSARDCFDTGWTSNAPLTPKPGEDPCARLGTYGGRQRTGSGATQVVTSVSETVPNAPAPGPASPGVVLFVPGGRLVSKDGPLPAGPIEFWVLFPGQNAPRMVGRITAQWLARLQRAFPDHPCGSHANPCVVPPS
jgi:hypothetical protein